MELTARTTYQPSTEALWGRGLRYLMLDELRRRPSMTVAELVAIIGGYGFTLNGRPSKVVSDTLRWEVRAGRVERLARGVYRYRPTRRSIMRRVVIFARLCRRWMHAAQTGGRLPPVPDEKRPPYRRLQAANRPPWGHLGWLWTT